MSCNAPRVQWVRVGCRIVFGRVRCTACLVGSRGVICGLQPPFARRALSTRRWLTGCGFRHHWLLPFSKACDRVSRAKRFVAENSLCLLKASLRGPPGSKFDLGQENALLLAIRTKKGAFFCVPRRRGSESGAQHLHRTSESRFGAQLNPCGSIVSAAGRAQCGRPPKERALLRCPGRGHR